MSHTTYIAYLILGCSCIAILFYLVYLRFRIYRIGQYALKVIDLYGEPGYKKLLTYRMLFSFKAINEKNYPCKPYSFHHFIEPLMAQAYKSMNEDYPLHATKINNKDHEVGMRLALSGYALIQLGYRKADANHTPNNALNDYGTDGTSIYYKPKSGYSFTIKNTRPDKHVVILGTPIVENDADYEKRLQKMIDKAVEEERYEDAAELKKKLDSLLK